MDLIYSNYKDKNLVLYFKLVIEDHIKLDKQRKLLDCDLGYEKLRMVLGLYHYIYKIIEFIQNMYIKVYCITYRKNFYLKGLEMDISY